MKILHHILFFLFFMTNPPFMKLIADSKKNSDPEELLDAADPLEDEITLNQTIVPDSMTDKSDDLTTWIEANYKHRGYVLMEGRQIHKANERAVLPSGSLEIGYSGSLHMHDIELYMDGNGSYNSSPTARTEGYLNLLGVRYRPLDSVLLVAGKERNRRSPGLVYSPGDFLHRSASAPGNQEDRQGIWLYRASYQQPSFTLDLILLPFSKETSDGFPDKDSKHYGQIVRGYSRISKIEMGLSYGELNERNHMGLFFQTFIADVWKLYAEYGAEEKKQVFIWNREKFSSWLIGGSYEGSSDFSIHAEYLEFPDMLNDKEADTLSMLLSDHNAANSLPVMTENRPSLQSLFFRRRYALFSFSFMEFMDRINFFSTYIRSLEDHSSAGIYRSEYIFDSDLTLGLAYTVFSDNMDHSVNLKPFKDQVTLDLRWSF